MDRHPPFARLRWAHALGIVTFGVAAGSAGAPVATAQSLASAEPQWRGWARCEIDIVAPGYIDRQSHLWILTPAPGANEGAIRVHPGTWSVVGMGSLQRSHGTQAIDAQWKTRAQGISAPIAFIVRASDGRLLIKSWHGQLRAAGAVIGTQQATIAGAKQPSASITLAAFEWPFPSLEASASVTSLSGSSTPQVAGSVGPMQPAGARGSSSCSWQFTRGSVAMAQSSQASTGTTAARPASSSAPLTAATPGSGITPPPTSSTPITRMPERSGARSIPAPKGNAGSTPPSSGPPPITQMPKMGSGLSLPPSQPTAPAGSPASTNRRLEDLNEVLRQMAETLPAQIASLLAMAKGHAVTEIARDGQLPIDSHPAGGAVELSSCPAIAAEVDQVYSSWIQYTQKAYDELHRAATTAQEQNLILKEAAVTIANLRRDRDKAMAEVLKACDSR